MGKRKGMCTKIEKKLAADLKWFEVGVEDARIYIQANEVNATDFLELTIVYSNDDVEFAGSFKEWKYCVTMDGPPDMSRKESVFPDSWGKLKL